MEAAEKEDEVVIEEVRKAQLVETGGGGGGGEGESNRAELARF